MKNFQTQLNKKKPFIKFFNRTIAIVTFVMLTYQNVYIDQTYNLWKKWRYNTSYTNVRQLHMKLTKNAIKSRVASELAVTSGMPIHQNVCIDYSYIQWKFCGAMCYQTQMPFIFVILFSSCYKKQCWKTKIRIN